VSRLTRRAGLAAFAALALADGLSAQAQRRYHLDLHWNRLHDYDELVVLMTRIANAWPRFVTMRSIGESWEGRELWMLTVANPDTGPLDDKPAFYTDANIHGNEVQGGEANLYLVWYLMEHYDSVKNVRELVDRVVFHVLPTVNADGRAAWFREANDSSSQRAPRKPFDDDLDGIADEDPPNDLDGDGEITQMRKRVPLGEGQWRQSEVHPEVMIRVRGAEQGDWVMLGNEGIDDDGDERIDEDGPGYYDMNRNWPSSWNPNYLQRGAGEYPLSHPETRAIARFFLEHQNLAGVQAFHNAGGMILRGPGLREYGEYPREDLAVYDAIGKEGEFMLPFYRYMIMHKDLYPVAGGFVNWTYEGLGIVSFTNEMWSAKRMVQGEQVLADVDRRRWDDLLTFGENYVAWHPVDHPFYGRIEVGGARKLSGRVPPPWLLEEELHRNAAFVAYHAGQMPHVELVELTVRPAPGGLSYVDVKARNDRLIPTRTQLAAEARLGVPDRLVFAGDGLEVVAGGVPTDRWRLERIRVQARDPARLKGESGVPSKADWHVRWIVAGKGPFTIRFESEKATDRRISGRVE
jgi:hypothetical protein